MAEETPPWAIVLAGDEGLRLRPLGEFVHGDHRPTPYATFLGSRPPLQQTLNRVAIRIDPERTVVIANARHAPYLSRDVTSRATHTHGASETGRRLRATPAGRRLSRRFAKSGIVPAWLDALTSGGGVRGGLAARHPALVGRRPSGALMRKLDTDGHASVARPTTGDSPMVAWARGLPRLPRD
jgi:hypothetical protein